MNFFYFSLVDINQPAVMDFDALVDEFNATSNNHRLGYYIQFDRDDLVACMLNAVYVDEERGLWYQRRATSLVYSYDMPSLYVKVKTEISRMLRVYY